MFKPKGNMILIEQLPVSKMSGGGIIMSSALEEKRQQRGQQVGIVREMGPDSYHKCSGFDGSEAYCEVGDVVLFPRYSGVQYQMSDIMNTTPKENETFWHLMEDTDVMGVMPKDQALEYKNQRGLKE